MLQASLELGVPSSVAALDPVRKFFIGVRHIKASSGKPHEVPVPCSNIKNAGPSVDFLVTVPRSKTPMALPVSSLRRVKDLCRSCFGRLASRLSHKTLEILQRL